MRLTTLQFETSSPLNAVGTVMIELGRDPASTLLKLREVQARFVSAGGVPLLDARTEKDELVWWSAQETSVYATGPSAAVETTGLAVQALLQSGEASGTARKALNYLASKKDSNGTWGTTQATIMALRALLTATEKGAADTRGTLEVLLNGKPAEKLELTPVSSGR